MAVKHRHNILSKYYSYISINEEYYNKFVFNIMVLLTMALLPVYAFSSGGFQLVDIPIFINACLLVFYIKGSNTKLLIAVYFYIPFVIWSILVNIGYSLISPDRYYFFIIAQFLQGIVIFYIYTILFDNLIYNNNLKYIYIGILLSIIMCFLIKGNYEEGVRNSLSFNNPNQLGYYALIVMSFTILLYEYCNRINYFNSLYIILNVLFILSAHILIILSLSRSAIFGIFILDIWLIKNIKRREIFYSIIIISILSAALLLIKPDLIDNQLKGRETRKYQDGAVTYALQERFSGQFKGMTTAQFIFGTGGLGGYETGGKQFVIKSKNSIATGEFHNTFGAILKYYGFIGISLFLLWIIKMLMYSITFKDSLFIYIALSFYNMTHYGIRFRPFWVLLSLILAVTYNISKLESRNKS